MPNNKEPTITKDHVLKASEDRIRRRLQAAKPDPASLHPTLRMQIDRSLASLPALEAAYHNDRNPVHVWDAILQISFAEQAGRTVEIPLWVRAYLYNATNVIMGCAVAWPNRGEIEPVPPDAGDSLHGLTPEQRPHVVMRALGFSKGRGSNPLVMARRDEEAARRVREIDRLKQEGLTNSAALRKLNDPGIRNHDDPLRKLRRDRKRLRGGGS